MRHRRRRIQRARLRQRRILTTYGALLEQINARRDRNGKPRMTPAQFVQYADSLTGKALL
jgi:hypothetical protein